MSRRLLRIYSDINYIEMDAGVPNESPGLFEYKRDSVRDQIGQAFWNVNGEQLRQLDAMILECIES